PTGRSGPGGARCHAGYRSGFGQPSILPPGGSAGPSSSGGEAISSPRRIVRRPRGHNVENMSQSSPQPERPARRPRHRRQDLHPGRPYSVPLVAVPAEPPGSVAPPESDAARGAVAVWASDAEPVDVVQQLRISSVERRLTFAGLTERSEA